MDSSNRRGEIVQAIIGLTSRMSGRAPVTTEAEIAEAMGVSKQTVRNHIDDVVEGEPTIQKGDLVGANIYYVSHERSLDDLGSDETILVGELPTDTHRAASYYEVRERHGDSRYKYEARWYDLDQNLLPAYEPNHRELGHLVDNARVLLDLQIKLFSGDE